MKALLILVLTLVSVNASAIQFYTEEDVKSALSVDNVIEVNPLSISALVQANPVCKEAIDSKSARAYVVKKGDTTALYVTDGAIQALEKCVEL